MDKVPFGTLMEPFMLENGMKERSTALVSKMNQMEILLKVDGKKEYIKVQIEVLFWTI